MGNCRDCAHWRGDWRMRDEMGDVLPVNYDDPDEYEKNSEPSEYRVCLGIPFMYDKRALHSAAAVMDGSGYTGRLVCRADFGCAFWQGAEGRPKHRLTVIGHLGTKLAYLDVPADEAVVRYLVTEGGSVDVERDVKEFEFEDEFSVYDAWV